MRDVQSLIDDLDSSESSVRDKAALQLMEIGDPAAIEPFIKAISKPQNVNHRGTLVYALGAFNCEAHIEMLVDLVLTGNFEVSTGAFAILQEGELSSEARSRVKIKLAQYSAGGPLGEHQGMGFEALSALAHRVA